ncbi:MAG: PKD domain-containing protein, partial [Kangiellaceae bacterium]|nr:PKD domain-containing protein [Kangiellaceae bacterium]
LYSEYDQVLIKVEENQAPAAMAGEDLQVETGKTVKLDGGDSFDPEQDQLTYEWEFIEKPAGHDTTLHFADTQTPEFDTYLEGRYIVQLIVDDGFQKSIPDTVTIEAKKNHIPVAVIDGETDQHGQVDQRVTFNGGNSYDPEGKSLTYQWTLTLVENSNAVLESRDGETTSFTPDLPGVYLLKLVVMDDIQESHYDLVRLTVYPAEEMIDVTLTGALLDNGNNPLEEILVYREGTFDGTATDQSGEFTFDFKVPKSELNSVNLLLADSNRIPRVKLNVTDFTENNTSVSIGQRHLPRLQRKDLAVWSCDEYSGPEDVDINFQLSVSDYDDMEFDYDHTKTFKPRLNTYIQYLPATATIKMSSEAAKVTVGINDTEWIHQYQENDESPDVVIIDVCNKD